MAVDIHEVRITNYQWLGVSGSVLLGPGSDTLLRLFPAFSQPYCWHLMGSPSFYLTVAKNFIVPMLPLEGVD